MREKSGSASQTVGASELFDLVDLLNAVMDVSLDVYGGGSVDISNTK